MTLTTVHCKLYAPPSCSHKDDDIGVADQDVESDPSSDHLTLQVVAPGVIDQDADSFFTSTRIRPLITQYIASCTTPSKIS